MWNCSLENSNVNARKFTSDQIIVHVCQVLRVPSIWRMISSICYIFVLSSSNGSPVFLDHSVSCRAVENCSELQTHEDYPLLVWTWNDAILVYIGCKSRRRQWRDTKYVHVSWIAHSTNMSVGAVFISRLFWFNIHPIWLSLKRGTTAARVRPEGANAGRDRPTYTYVRWSWLTIRFLSPIPELLRALHTLCFLHNIKLTITYAYGYMCASSTSLENSLLNPYEELLHFRQQILSLYLKTEHKAALPQLTAQFEFKHRGNLALTFVEFYFPWGSRGIYWASFVPENGRLHFVKIAKRVHFNSYVC